MTAEEYEALLDNYRGRCQECGRVNVLLEFNGCYDGMETRCLLDREECDRLTHERRKREAEEFRKRVEAGEPKALMMKRMFDAFRPRTPVFIDTSKPRTMEWRRYGDFVKTDEL